MERARNLRGRRNLDGNSFCRWPALLLVASSLGCGGVTGSAPPQPPPPNIVVTVAPASVPLLLGESQTFTATVSNTTNTAATWSVNQVPGGNSTVGTVNPDGVYSAPAILPVPATVTVEAISVADPSKGGSASVTITSGISLSVAGPASVNAGSTATYTATLTPAPNSNPSRVITWSVTGAGCAGSSCGTISPDGVYTAPSLAPSPATIQVIATPQADPSKAASISVTDIAMVSVSVSPTSATVALGASQAFRAAVMGTKDTSVTWDVNGVVGGNTTVGSILNSQTIPDSTTYTAPLSMPAGGSVTVRARSNAYPNISATATVSFTAAINVALSPASATLAIGERQTFSVQVNNSQNQNVAWEVNGVAGGNNLVGQICVVASSPCQPVLSSNGGSVDFLAPAGLPSPNPVSIIATSASDNTKSASVTVTILPHVVVSVLPGSVSVASNAQQRFSASVTGTNNQSVIWSVSGSTCGDPGACGSIDSSGLYIAPPVAPSPNLISVVATSLEDSTQSGSATVTITSAPAISSLAPTSAYAGTSGGFTLSVLGNNFSPPSPGPASTILVAGTARATSCSSNTQCTTALSAADLASAGNLSVQMQNPGGLLSNTEIFVVLAPGTAPVPVPLTPGSPSSTGDDIVVVDLSTDGDSGAPADISLNIAAMGIFNVAMNSCTLGGNPVVIDRPASGIATADICVFSVSGLSPSFAYTISGPPTPDVAISSRAPLGLGIVHLTLQVPATAVPGPRTLFVQNPEGDMASGTGSIEVR